MIDKLRKLHLRHVNERLKSLKENDLVPRPPKGWIRFIREALGMSSKALSQRLKISATTMSETERAEWEEAITIKRLRKVADAMNCDLVYYFLPRVDIQKMIDERARHLALQKIHNTQGHMELEDQGLSSEYLEDQLNETILELKKSKKLWDEH